MFDGPTTQNLVNEIIEPFGGTKSAEYIRVLSSYVRYLAHLDNPDKAQYNPAEIVALNGADLGDAQKLTHSDKYKIIKEILRFCEDNNINEFSSLAKYATIERDDWLPVIVEKPYFFNQFVASIRHSKNNFSKDKPPPRKK